VQERAGNTLELIGIGNDFLKRTQMVQQLRIDKWDYFCIAKEMVTRLKRQFTEWKKIFASYTSDNGSVIRISRELKKLNSPKSMTQ
jgi:hypothetical protein